MALSPAIQNIISFALAIIWAVGSIILYFHTRAKQVVYLRHFSPVNGAPLEWVMSGNPFGVEARTIYRLMWQRQADPELEQRRREIWRRQRYAIVWMFRFPILAVGVAALLIATGAINVMAK